MKKNESGFEKLWSINKKNIIYIIILFCNVIIPYLIWANKDISFLPYNIDNYRYIISAALQSIAAIFAFIASSTILIFQLSSDNSPKSISFFPKKIFILVMVELLTIISIDGIVLITLSTELKELHLFILNFIIFLNAESIALVIAYVLEVIKWLRPETMFEILLNNAKQADSNEERLEIVLSVEELTLKTIQKGYSSTAKIAIELFGNIIAIYSTEKTDLNLKAAFNTEHPLRIISSSISRIAKCLSKNDMDDFIHFTAHSLAKLSIVSEDMQGLSVCSVEVSSAVDNIIRECLKKNLDSAVYNFIADFSYTANDEDNTRSVALCLKSIVEEALKYEDTEYVISEVLEGYTFLVENHVDEIEVYCKEAISEIKRYPAVLRKKGWYTEDNIGHKIMSLENLLRNKNKKQIKKEA